MVDRHRGVAVHVDDGEAQYVRAPRGDVALVQVLGHQPADGGAAHVVRAARVVDPVRGPHRLHGVGREAVDRRSVRRDQLVDRHLVLERAHARIERGEPCLVGGVQRSPCLVEVVWVNRRTALILASRQTFASVII